MSSADAAAGFKYSFDFDNNGTWDVTDSATASASTTFATAGAKTVKGRIKDKDGGSTDYTTTVTVADPAGPGLVAAFSFDEGSGATVRSSVGGLTGTISGASWVTGGQSGGALSFNGTTNKVTVPDANALDLTTGMTLEAWVQPKAVGNWATILLKENGTSGLAYALYGSEDTGKPAGFVNTGGSDVDATGPTNTATGTWTHLAATYDGSNLRLYTNGTLVRTTANAASLVTTTGGAVDRRERRVGRILQRADRRGPGL